MLYASTSEAEDEDKVTFYSRLQEIVNKDRKFYKMIMGDFNAKIGTNTNGSASVEPYGLGIRSCEGIRLVEFSKRNKLKIVNTFFKKREAQKWTWVASNIRVKNEIDHCLINDKSVVEDHSVLARFEFSSYHGVSRSAFQIPHRPKIKGCAKCANECI